MSARRFDVVVLGSGPGGEGASMKAVKSGRKVCTVEQGALVGGACTHTATIPSKALRHAIQRLMDVQQDHPEMRADLARHTTLKDMMRVATTVVSKQVQLRTTFYERNRVELVVGRAKFRDAHTVEVTEPRGSVELLTADAFVIATGSRPYRPSGVDFRHPRIFDSDTILKLRESPLSMIIYGAGVIGCEYASMFRMLGVKVDLVNTRDRLLSFLDDEISDALSYHLREQGVLIRHQEEMVSVEPHDDSVVLQLKSGKRLKADVFLWANGRSGNSQDLGLEALGIAVDARGCIQVNDGYQTSVPHIYAVGDVVGAPSLASASYDQGRFAATHIVEGRAEHKLVKDIPTGIYTSPEISSLGRTERELTQAGIPYEVGHAFFKSLARAQITGRTVGMLKLLFHRETREILGIHCFGDNASEIIHIGQAIMAQDWPGNGIDYFINTTFNYPTMAEAYRVAALNGLNRLF
ncbi:Si-specific NAD(P)(+) transhydrogenase [Corallococcus exiguus]|uniref:Si-specific NAD(P)(+) transhydrogenase n=1 Tax=Corallococcus TaxID=83461 RepID=UPI000EF0DBA5|nr:MULTISPECIES: Si-specific NAD(P)(+) transhydrogenase [Corallococcus]NNB88667.1 Si-specific NAD(P)(+) transhydrogenase [Corallococcus exiguus]NNB96445.1 Si-specific NAD(P)(+) transhydrogenase [Corallococcus exiguus]NNC03332.1 Si-specific NAD(P)(+) transhydrogenase [Corallococcus exiguus]NPC49189.1 Si-specific NAD(P)(+) transhydrogenase [Corallococcus exiguus]RKH86005.1 Si-specific NAD(P)(+) transhydrogenase [Corallococcus sp. AB032C]